jgi:hypothetical protein
MNTQEAIDFGEPISVYTSRQAIEDGILIEPSRETHPNCLMTCAVYEHIRRREEIPEDRSDEATALRWKQRVVPLLMDALMIIRANPDDYLWTNGLDGNLTGRELWIALNDIGGFTLMFPEDY